MKTQVVTAAAALALAFAAGAGAQQKPGAKPQEMEAVVTVTKVDPASRLVHVQAKTRKAELHLAPDIDIASIKEGSRYRLRWAEATATAVEPGADAASAGATRRAEVEKVGAGAGTITAQRSGVVDKVDAASERLTLRTLEGTTETFKLGQGVSMASLKPGEAVTVTYRRPVVSQMRSTPQPVTDPAAPQ
jgi:hypothetical protein